ncbi:YihY/virulence factor BrkB family protein [Agrilactobacillus fermenti]|uniref:YihY/virulence factor BrkB family protein n=1 Tax=Agrilactobacillus fermenti TaxID=2586909 RepID=UPI001E2FC97D|nr:YihY/virulence factor BrkB family protein [Agrilactobacillus fermenti]MCD2255173.1 YihY/virulence factor BrkB family protein [Agrilactobacillus fermenti]
MSFKTKATQFLQQSKTLISELTQRSSATEIGNNAKVITYFVLFSVFPFIIFLGNLLPLLHLNVENIMTYVNYAIPGQLAKTLSPIIKRLLTNGSGGIASISGLAALWGASRGFNIVRQSVNKAYQVDPQYGDTAVVNAIIRRLVAFLFTFGIVLVIFALSIVFIFGQRFLEWVLPIFKLPSTILDIFTRWRWPVVGIGLFVVMWLMYYFLPSAKIKFVSVFPGTIVTTVSWLAISQAFSFYVTHFGQWDSYGTLGVFVILLLWMNIIAMVFMFGAILNAIFQERRFGPIKVRSLENQRRKLVGHKAK